MKQLKDIRSIYKKEETAKYAKNIKKPLRTNSKK
jgi:hypothetical protein